MTILNKASTIRKQGITINWTIIVTHAVLFSSFLPKLIIVPGVNIFLPELVILLCLLHVGFKQFFYFSEQRYLFGIFFFIFLFSFWSLLELSDVGSILRSVKEILYIAIIYWSSKVTNKNKLLVSIVKYGALAMIVNLIVFISNFAGFGSIWGDDSSLSSGMSNQGFNLLKMRLEHLEGLSHGIWGSYCVLVVVLCATLYSNKLISLRWISLIGILFIINTVISVSRESLLVFFVVILLFIIMPQRKIVNKILILTVLVATIFAVIMFGETLPIFQKVAYMMDSLSSGGADGNFQLRINTWIAYLNYLRENVYGFLIGFGLSPDNFYQNIKPYASREIVDLPESAVVYVQAYGGFLAFLCFLGLLFICFKNVNKNTKYKLVKYFFVGILVTNIISSVSMFSDLLYAHLCLVYGLLILNKNNINEIKSTAHNR